MPLPLAVSCFSKIRIGLYRLTRVVPDKGPLNMCVCVCVCVCVCFMRRMFNRLFIYVTLHEATQIKTGAFCCCKFLLASCTLWLMATNALGLGIDDRGFFNVITFTVCVPFCFAYKWQIVLDLLLLLLHPFNGLFSRTIWVIRYQKDKISLDSNEARDDGVQGWQWQQLDHMQTICTSLQTENSH